MNNNIVRQAQKPSKNAPKGKTKRSFWSHFRTPRNKKRALIIFWSLVALPFLSIATLLVMIISGVFGQLPTFEELENPKSNIATEIISSDGENMGTFYYENRSFVDYSELSPYLVQALVATEDSRFYNHSGIDFIGLSRVAFKTLLLSQGQGGGSTISQQLAKNLYPRDTSSSGKIGRIGKLVISKLKEWITATMLEYNYTKEEIVAMYLNTMAYGSNSYGIKSAARTFFNKLPSELTVDESALLVGVVNAPTRYSPVRNPKNALSRRNTVLGRMETAGFISADSLKVYQAREITLDYQPLTHNDGSATYFREMLRGYMTAKEPDKSSYQNEWDYGVARNLWDNDPLYGWCNKNHKADGTPYNLYSDGLKIYTTINSRMQQYAEESVLEQMGADKTGIQAVFDAQKKNYGGKIFYNTTTEENNAIIRRSILQSERARVMRNAGASEDKIIEAFDQKQQMTIFTYQGDRDTVMTPRDSMMHYKGILRTGFMAMDPNTGYVLAYVGGTNFRHFKYDMVKQGRRQVGSTMKPFIYTFAIDNLGYNPYTPIPNLPVTVELGNGQTWSPKEAGNVEYDGQPRELRWGLANSRNNYSAWIMKQTNPQAVADFIHKMGVSSWIDPVYSLCLGTAEISIFEMVGAFATFANRGIHTEPMFVTRIEDRQGNTLSMFSARTNDAISEDVAFTMLGMLQNNIVAGTGGRLT
ncbi:MAG: transglycosylase domain-containing protein, partial [Rikenellaceae bacterium]